MSTRRPLDPRRVGIAIDGNVYNSGEAAHNDRTTRLQSLVADGLLTLVIPGGVRDEVQHPNTPEEKKTALLPQIFNLRLSRNESQQTTRRIVQSILQGNAKPGAHTADASHLSEAAETGCGYFVTHDARILKKRDELSAVLPPSLQIVSLEELLSIHDDYVEGRR